MSNNDIYEYWNNAMIMPIHFNYYFLPEYSGNTLRLYNIIKRLQEKVIIITSDSKLNNEHISTKYETIDNIEIYRIPIDRKNFINKSTLSPIDTFYNFNYRLPRLVKKIIPNADLIHVHNLQPFYKVARKLSKIKRCPLVFEWHIQEFDYFKDYYRGINGIKSVYMSYECKKLIERSDKIITLTESQKKLVSESYNIPLEKIIAIPNGVDTVKFSPHVENDLIIDNIKSKLGIKNKIVLYAGYLDQINGITDLVNCIPHILKNRNDINFVFIGHGPEEKRIISMSQKYHQVKHITTVPYNKIPAYYQMCDLFVLPRPSIPSTETISPLKLYEALSMGKKVLGSNVGGISEILKDGINGFLYEKDNMTSFEKELFNAIDNNDSTITNNARNTVLNKYTWEVSSQKLQKLYNELI